MLHAIWCPKVAGKAFPFGIDAVHHDCEQAMGLNDGAALWQPTPFQIHPRCFLVGADAVKGRVWGGQGA